MATLSICQFVNLSIPLPPPVQQLQVLDGEDLLGVSRAPPVLRTEVFVRSLHHHVADVRRAEAPEDAPGAAGMEIGSDDQRLTDTAFLELDVDCLDLRDRGPCPRAQRSEDFARCAAIYG